MGEMARTHTTLGDLARQLADEGLTTPRTALSAEERALALTGADCDSRVIRPGHLFVCKGAQFKTAYLTKALEAGACAYLCDESHANELAAAAPGVPALAAPDDRLRRAMAVASAEAWGHPDRALTVVGLTGTKGKSTTAYLLRAILAEHVATRVCGATPPAQGVGLIGSIETIDGVGSGESVNTTPEAPDLWRHLATMRDAGLRYAVMEVSSQALKYHRVDCLRLDVAAFTNIGEDHISPLEHPTFEDYFSSKLRIFEQARRAVVNLDADHVERILAAAHGCERLLTFSLRGRDADVWARDVEPSHGHLRFWVHTPSWEGKAELGMPGSFNVENALAAICCAEYLGIPADETVRGLARTRVPGRMEIVDAPELGLTGIVDFAHNKMAFSRLFPAVRQEFPGCKVIAVFGATGDKAVERRRELPAEAARWTDRLIFTKDDPGFERVEDICREMAASTPAGTPYEIVPDRAEAVRRAVDLAADDPTHVVVCVLARGTEGSQHERGRLVPSPLDADLLAAAIEARRRA